MSAAPHGPPPHRAFLAIFAFLALIGLARFWAWHSCTLDMAYYTRLVWGLGQGDPSQPVIDAPHWLGLHFEPVLLPLAGLSRLGVPTAELLLVVQALCGAAAIYPALALARRHLPAHAWPVALSLFLVPAFGRNLDFDFHPGTLSVWPLLAFVERLDGGRSGRAAVWLSLAALCREDVGLQGAAAALVAPAVSSRWRAGFVVAGALYFGAYSGLVQPAFAHTHAASSFEQHFGALGAATAAPVGGVGEILSAVFQSPTGLVAHLWTLDRVLYPVLLLVGFAALPALAPRWLGGALPILAINLLSGFDGIRELQTRYLTAAVPFLFASAVIGAGRAGNPFFAARALVTAVALSFCTALDPSIIGRARDWFPDEDTARRRAAAAVVPPGAPVIAPSELLAHLACRPRAHHPRFAPARGAWRIDADLTVHPPQ